MSFYPFNNDGKFSINNLGRVLLGVDNCNNPCVIRDGVVTRVYDRSGEIPSYAEKDGYYYVGDEKVNNDSDKVYYYSEKTPRELSGFRTNFYDYGINIGGKVVCTNPSVSNETTLRDCHSHGITIDEKGNIIGHEGPIYCDNGLRLYVDRFNRVDILQTKLFYLFDFLEKVLSLSEQEYLDLLDSDYGIKYVISGDKHFGKGEYFSYSQSRPEIGTIYYPFKTISIKMGDKKFTIIKNPNGTIGGCLNSIGIEPKSFDELSYSEEMEDLINEILEDAYYMKADENAILGCSQNEILRALISQVKSEKENNEKIKQ